MSKKVFVGMSGGVDSSVAALLLKEQGYDVTGVYMKNWSRDLPGMKCPWAEDLADAKRVAVKLGLDFEVWDFEEAYREKVVEYMLAEFRRGHTPNPDVMCNQEIKFKLFYEKTRERGADWIATGHYARVEHDEMVEKRPGVEHDEMVEKRPGVEHGRTEERLSTEGVSAQKNSIQGNGGTSDENMADKPRTQSQTAEKRPRLLRAVDENKDQTYFLYRITDEALAHTLFPIGGMRKPEVKKLAAERGLHNAYKKESMGVCFVGEVGMKDFLQEYLESTPGEIREMESGRALGYHEGAIFYTIGQRHGLYLNGNKGEINDGLPYYVVAKDLEQNVVYVSKNLNNEHIWAKELKLRDVVWREKNAPSLEHPRAVWVRLRHRAELVPAQFDGQKVSFKTAMKRPASGQSAVLYDGEVCLGGGIIE